MNAGSLSSNPGFFPCPLLCDHVQWHKGVVFVSWAAVSRHPSPNTSTETDPLVSTHMLLDPPATHV